MSDDRDDSAAGLRAHFDARFDRLTYIIVALVLGTGGGAEAVRALLGGG